MTAAKPEQDLEGLRLKVMKVFAAHMNWGGGVDDIVRLVQAEVSLTVERAFMKIELQPLRDSAVSLPPLLAGAEMKWRDGYKAGAANLAAAIKAELHPPQQPPMEGGSE